VFIEVLLGIISVISILSLLISWISLNLQLEFRNGVVDILSDLSQPSNDTAKIMRTVNEIQEFLSQLMQVMGNPFQMLAATHGARILDRIFPPKVEPMQEDRGDSSLLPSSPSEEAWQDADQHQNAEEAEEVPE